MRLLQQIAAASILLLIPTSCDIQCWRVACDIMPYVEFGFEFVNASDENLIQKGDLTIDDISFTMDRSNQEIAVSIYENRVIVQFWTSEPEYTMVVGAHTFKISARVELVDNGGCCEGLELKSLSIDGVVVTPSSPGNTITLVL
jgi:hypothetical protein